MVKHHPPLSRGTPLDIAGALEGRRALGPPGQVTVDITNRCDNNCMVCRKHSPLLGDMAPGTKWREQEMPRKQLFHLINELSSLGVKRVQFNGGGEPLMHPSCLEGLERIKAQGMEAALSTGFTLVDDGAIERLVAMRVDEIMVSLWAASPHTYSRLHPNKSAATFLRIREHLADLCRRKSSSTRITVSNVLFCMNIQEVTAMYQLALDVGADAVSYQLMDPVMGCTDSLLLQPMEQVQLIAKMEKVRQMAGTCRKPGVELVDHDEFLQRLRLNDPVLGRYDIRYVDRTPCYAGWSFSRVLPNGDVCPCRRGDKKPLGNLNERSFPDIWFSAPYDDFRNKARILKKSDSYFQMMDCYATCYNRAQNVAFHRRLEAFLARQKGGQKEICKKGDVLLAVCPPWDVEKPPLNLAYLAEYLRMKGIAVSVYDFNLECHYQAPNERIKWLWTMHAANEVSTEELSGEMIKGYDRLIDEVVQDIVSSDPAAIGFSVNYRNIGVTEELVRRIKREAPAKPVVYGGAEVYCQMIVGQLANKRADAFVVGEGEITLLELLPHLTKGARPKIPGVIWNDKGRLTELSLRGPIRPLEQLPFPRYADFDLERYRNEVPHLPFLSSRGCVNKCSFCMDHYLTGGFRTRDPAHALAELKHHIKKHRIRHFSFNDLLCNGNVKQLFNLCRMIRDERLDIQWWSYAAIHRKMSDELLMMMKEAGCVHINYGFESGSGSVLKRMNKFYSPGDAEDVIRRTYEAGIQTSVNVIVGFPGENEDEFQETCDFLSRNHEVISQITNLGACMICPGSDIEQNPGKYGVNIRDGGNWSDDTGNTLELRMERLHRIQELIQALDISNIIVNKPASGNDRS